jgi:hypothetical protein
MAVKDNAEVFVVKDMKDIYVIESSRRTQTHRHQKHHDITAIIREHYEHYGQTISRTSIFYELIKHGYCNFGSKTFDEVGSGTNIF